MNRSEATELVREARRRKGSGYTDLAERLGVDRAWLTAALLGQHPLDARQAEQLRELLEFPEEVVPVLAEIPHRGSLESVPPTDPTIYRIYEALQVYGTTIKELINEDFGDGIMSAITFNLDVQRQETEEGPRVRIVLDGKFLPYKW
ncbi:cyanate lyase [Actinopolyspora biskrensis]|uniref:Cyanate hydratase n=1 Tax=Actinopolyspora biskrensis TaxID=1470178 RepID=A0A852Z1B0_9ACTN|nr:cyanase [Actinopolyspora biskrensis]NYH79549.1 cyanate lyase [Actinopolyspora biskrensis]